MHAALPYLCPSNYPTLATPLILGYIPKDMRFCYNFIVTHPVYEIMCGWG